MVQHKTFYMLLCCIKIYAASETHYVRLIIALSIFSGTALDSPVLIAVLVRQWYCMPVTFNQSKLSHYYSGLRENIKNICFNAFITTWCISNGHKCVDLLLAKHISRQIVLSFPSFHYYDYDKEKSVITPITKQIGSTSIPNVNVYLKISFAWKHVIVISGQTWVHAPISENNCAVLI